MNTDVLILGGGISGLAAAYEVSSRGYKATIVDETWSLGGQLRQQTQIIDSLPPQLSKLRGFQVAEALVKRLKNFPVEYLLQHEAIGLYADGSVGVSNGRKLGKILFSSLVVATGAAEAALPFPGWTLPGVMTIGAAQILMNRERVYPGKVALVIGSSDLAFEISKQMHDVGIIVAGIVESGGQVKAQDDVIISAFHTAGIPIFLQTEVVSASGSGRVEEVLLSSGKCGCVKEKFVVDLICIDGGRYPVLEVFSILNCRLSYRKDLGGWLPCYKENLESSVDGIFVAGQAAGITCSAGVFLTGAIAGISAVEFIEKKPTRELEAARQVYWEELKSLENTKLPAVWQARICHIEAYPHKKPAHFVEASNVA